LELTKREDVKYGIILNFILISLNIFAKSNNKQSNPLLCYFNKKPNKLSNLTDSIKSYIKVNHSAIALLFLKTLILTLR